MVKSDITCGILNGHEGERDKLQYIVNSSYCIGHRRIVRIPMVMNAVIM